GGLLAVQARTGKDASIAVAFFAVAGFAAGFSERFASDVLQRASSGMLPTTQGKQAVEKPDELSLLLSEQPRHAATPTATQEPQRYPRAPGIRAEEEHGAEALAHALPPAPVNAEASHVDSTEYERPSGIATLRRLKARLAARYRQTLPDPRQATAPRTP